MHKIVFSLLLVGSVLAARADPLPKNFSHPSRIRYDGQCLSIDDRDAFIFSAFFSYFRTPEPLWRDRFRRLKEAGCNAVETDVPDDFSPAHAAGLRDWLRLAEGEFGLYAIVELGGHGMGAVCPVIAPEQITRKPPGHPGVILVGIQGAGAADLRSLYRAAITGGIEVPIFACGAKECRQSEDPLLSQVFDSVNAHPRFDLDATARDLAALEAAQVDAPAMISELQGGPDAILAVQDGATILNCAAPPEGSKGDGDNFSAMAAVGRMLRDRGAAFARSYPVKCQAETGDPDVTVAARRTREGATYLFFRNRSDAASKHGTAAIWLQGRGEAGVDYALKPFGFKILYMAPGARWPFESGRDVPSQEPGIGVEWLP